MHEAERRKYDAATGTVLSTHIRWVVLLAEHSSGIDRVCALPEFHHRFRHIVHGTQVLRIERYVVSASRIQSNMEQLHDLRESTGSEYVVKFACAGVKEVRGLPREWMEWGEESGDPRDTEDLWQQSINGIYEVGYAISLVALLLSLGILTYFRSLRCARITLHMNLFTSFAINNALWLIWYRFIVANTDVLLNNDIPCRVLHTFLHYFLLTNYAWMLCEGFYLHTLLVSAFTSEHKLVNWLMGLGWPVPAVIVTLYTALRASSDDPADTEQCWINEGNYMNVLVYPVCVSTMLNLLFLFNIVRVLLMKLRAGPAIGTRPSRSMLQAFRATLLLVPLLGLHYLVIPFRPPKKHPWEHFYEVLSAITASFQGLCVAVLFCFCNGEVIAQFKRKWDGNTLLRKRANSCTATTVSFIRSTAGPMAGEEKV
ncbi:calcitonin gene-related peptide type 1 receptor isoform X3 [Polyergus mexicanus]|uniref:calcitonin gene-related peptide type 1 receptor isoform X3 n=1 Tax=Polyergus mexicanus TaxID=615972 RepID=UPI0038B53395